MPNVQIYTKSYCPYCALAKKRLAQLGIPFEEFDVTFDSAREKEMRLRSQRNTVPQIFIGDTHIGGSDDLDAAIRSGRLKKILSRLSLTD